MKVKMWEKGFWSGYNDHSSLLAPQADSDLMVFLAKERVVKKLSQSTSDRTRKIVNYPCIG